MKYRLTIYPTLEWSKKFKVFHFESRVEAFAAMNSSADLLLFLQDDLKAMDDYSNSMVIEEFIDGEWQEVEE